MSPGCIYSRTTSGTLEAWTTCRSFEFDANVEEQKKTSGLWISFLACTHVKLANLSKLWNSAPTFDRVVGAKVGSPVDDDALHGHAETTVKTSWSVGFKYFP